MNVNDSRNDLVENSEIREKIKIFKCQMIVFFPSAVKLEKGCEM